MADAEKDWLGMLMMLWRSDRTAYMIFLLAVLGQESGRGRHREVLKMSFELKVMNEGGETSFRRRIHFQPKIEAMSD